MGRKLIAGREPEPEAGGGPLIGEWKRSWDRGTELTEGDYYEYTRPYPGTRLRVVLREEVEKGHRGLFRVEMSKDGSEKAAHYGRGLRVVAAKRRAEKVSHSHAWLCHLGIVVCEGNPVPCDFCAAYMDKRGGGGSMAAAALFDSASVPKAPVEPPSPHNMTGEELAVWHLVTEFASLMLNRFQHYLPSKGTSWKQTPAILLNGGIINNFSEAAEALEEGRLGDAIQPLVDCANYCAMSLDRLRERLRAETLAELVGDEDGEPDEDEAAEAEYFGHGLSETQAAEGDDNEA